MQFGSLVLIDDPWEAEEERRAVTIKDYIALRRQTKRLSKLDGSTKTTRRKKVPA